MALVAHRAGQAVDRRIVGQGTPAEQWRAWRGWSAVRRVPAAQVVPPGSRLVVVAPHPDDEVLGAGGLIAQAAALGRDLLLVAATDGEGSHPDSSAWPRVRLAFARARETRHALRLLGARAMSVVRLRLGDGTLAAQGRRLSGCLRALLRPHDVVCVTWRYDGHPDHESLARATRAAVLHHGVTCLEMPVWGWHWSRPGHAPMPWHRALRVTMSPVLQARKGRALAAFGSQLTDDESTGRPPILPPWALARVLGPQETFFR